MIHCCALCGGTETFPSSWHPRLMEKPPREHSAVHSLLCQQGRVFSLILALPQGKNQGEQQAQGGECEHLATGLLVLPRQESPGSSSCCRGTSPGLSCSSWVSAPLQEQGQDLAMLNISMWTRLPRNWASPAAANSPGLCIWQPWLSPTSRFPFKEWGKKNERRS